MVLASCGTYYDPADSYVRGVRFYDRGDYVTARQIWQPLAEAGDCDAQFRMGTLYFQGQAAISDIAAARKNFLEAANQGQPRAQIVLGDLYASVPGDKGSSFSGFWCDGPDCPKDLAEAYKWYLLAEKFSGYAADKKLVHSALGSVRGRMSPAQRQEGEQRASAWRPAPQMCKTRVLL